jgi:hypothetical protein
MRILPVVAGIALLLQLIFAGEMFAQDQSEENRSRWGVSFTATPQWNYLQLIPETFGKIAGETPTVDVHGSEFTFGFVRGSDNGGDWGVSLVKRSIADGSFIKGEFNNPTVFSNSSITGVEVHKYSPYLRTRWVQVGLTTAIGIGSIAGTTQQEIIRHDGGTEIVPGTAANALNELLNLGDSKMTPIGRVELTAGIRATDRLKVKVGGGLSFPGTSVFRVGVNYLFQ